MMEESDGSSENENNEIIPKEMLEAARAITMDLLPQKSKQNYTAAYNDFKKWRKEMKTNSFDEVVLLNYFDYLSKTYAPNSLWSTFSKLKITISSYDKVDIGKYKKLQAYLKKKNSGYQPRKSAVFSKDDIMRLLNDAPDEIYLSTKVALIMGITGALRRCEFVNLLVSDVLEGEDLLLINVRLTKNKVPRSFTIIGELYQICKKYRKARPESCPTDRFFLKYLKGKCICQPIGINKFGAMPKDIALYLLLLDAEEFTGHSFRRTSATLLVDAGADITALKRHGGWKSNSVAEGYIADSLNNKKKVYKQITSGIVIDKVVDTGNINSNIPAVTVDAAITPTTSSALNTVQPISTNTNVPKNFIARRSSASGTYTSNRNTPIVENSISETPSVSQIPISNSNILVDGDFILETTRSNQIQRIDKKEPKLPVFYDPSIGLFVDDMINGSANKTIVLNNCKVTIHSDLNDHIILNNCSI